MEKTLEDLKFEKAWLCAVLMELRDALKNGRRLSANTKIGKEEFTVLEDIEATLDNVGAVECLAEDRARWKLEFLQWYRERGRFVFPDMKPPEGWEP